MHKLFSKCQEALRGAVFADVSLRLRTEIKACTEQHWVAPISVKSSHYISE